MFSKLKDIEDWSNSVKLTKEKEMLGLYVSDHPLFGVQKALQTMCTSDIPGLWEPLEVSTGQIDFQAGTGLPCASRKGRKRKIAGRITVIAEER